MKELLIALYLIVGALHCLGNVTDDYYYRPYPVLLVHGFNADNTTWNAQTFKADKKKYKLSTIIKDNSVVKDPQKPSIAKTLIEKFTINNHLPDSTTNPASDLNLFKDFYKNELDATEPRRIQPWEEDGSYNGINHTYVELYGNYYCNEGNDGYGRTGQNAVSQK